MPATPDVVEIILQTEPSHFHVRESALNSSSNAGESGKSIAILGPDGLGAFTESSYILP
jgi:hypothetical protein